MQRILTLILMGAFFLIRQGPARADFQVTDSDITQAIVFIDAIGLASMGTTVVKTVIASGGVRPRVGWLIAGGVLGSLNIFSGSVAIKLDGGDTLGLAVGIPLIVIGAADIGTTIWGWILPKKKDRLSVSVVPQLTTDLAGNASYGLGLRVAGF